MNNAPTARIAWIARCIARLKRHYDSGVLAPSGTPLNWAAYIRLTACVLSEHREDV